MKAGRRRCTTTRCRRAVHEPSAAGEEHGAGEPLARDRDTYAQVNELFGDIVKVTPSSKVVGTWHCSW